MAYQKRLIVLVEEFENYLNEETICSLAIEGIKPDLGSPSAVNYLKTASELYKMAISGVPLGEGVILYAFEKLWEGFSLEKGYRKVPMTILGAKFEAPPPEIVPFLMERLIEYYSNSKVEPIKKASRFHLLFEVIHPFVDGNGRLGRILLNYILIENGLINVAFRNRESYLKSLKEDEKPAIWVVEKFSRGRKLNAEQIDEYFKQYGKNYLEDLIRKEMLHSLKVYARIENAYISSDIACQLIGCKNKDYIRVLVNRGRLVGKKEAGVWKIHLASLIEYREPEKPEEVIGIIFP